MTQLHPETRSAVERDAIQQPRDRLPVGLADDLAPVLADDLAAVEERLDRFFSTRITAADAYDASYRRLWEGARDAADGGKRIRPRFVLTAYRGLGGTEPDVACTAAVAYELLHTAFLLHDDVIDGDTVRRGRPNVAGGFAAAAEARGRAPSAHAAGARPAPSLRATCCCTPPRRSSPASTPTSGRGNACSTSSTTAYSSPPQASSPMSPWPKGWERRPPPSATSSP